VKGRLFITLFALPFFGVGVWMFWAIGNSLHDVWEMHSWQPAAAKLISAGYHTHSGDDSNTYEAYATYTYTFFSQTHTGDRVSISSGADNIGDYQQDTGQRLSTALSRNATIYIWVNPEKPHEAVIDRGLRWGLIGFKSIFLFVFGGVGLGLIIFVWRAPKEKDASKPEFQTSPWLLNSDWQTNVIRSSSKLAMWAAWAFAAIWRNAGCARSFSGFHWRPRRWHDRYKPAV